MNIKRLLIINQCLKDNTKKWSLQDLIDACKDTGKNSKRSVQADLELMRNSVKGYNAPIKVVEKKYYSYDDKKYTLLNQTLTELDKQNILEALNVLYDYSAFSSLKNIESPLITLHEKIAQSLNLPLPVKVDNSQRVELEEIDGSVILQYNMVVSKKIEDFLIANHDKIKVVSPNSLQNKIKKFING